MRQFGAVGAAWRRGCREMTANVRGDNDDIIETMKSGVSKYGEAA